MEMPNLNQLSNNPLFQRAQEMAKGKSPEELQRIAQNICEEKGINIGQLWQQFQEFQKMFK